jgi:Ca2+-binding EF-hand superfamily protein
MFKSRAITRYQRPGLTEDEIEEIKEAFDLFDTDGYYI